MTRNQQMLQAKARALQQEETPHAKALAELVALLAAEVINLQRQVDEAKTTADRANRMSRMPWRG